MPASERNDLNVSRRLTRMLKASGLPHVGKAHVLRMRYVRATHIWLLLIHQCTHSAIVRAMRELLEGWADTEEEATDVGGYQHQLLHRTNAIHAQIDQHSSTWLRFRDRVDRV